MQLRSTPTQPFRLILLILLAAGGHQLCAQGPALEFGVRGESGNGIGPQRLPGIPGCPECGADGSTTERRINFSVGLFLPNSLNNDFGFRLRAGGTFVTGTNTSDPYQLGLAVDSAGNPVPIELNYQIDYSPTQLQFEFLGEYLPVPWARAFAGPWGALRLNESYIQTERILQPENARFFSGQRERTAASGSEVSPARGTFGLVVGAGVQWRVAPRITLLPDLLARLTFDVREDIIGVAALTVGGGIGLQVDLLPAPPSAIAPDTPLVVPQPPIATDPQPLDSVKDARSDSAQVASQAKPPTATIDLFVVDSVGNPAQVARLRSMLTRHTRATMIPRTLDCSQLPPMIAASTAASPHWTPDSLTRADHDAVQQRALLTIAARLHRVRAAAQLVIEGGSSDCRGRLRAALVGPLQTEPSSIKMQDGGKFVGSSVRFSATGEGAGELLTAITNEWFVEDIEEPAFSVLPTMSAESGVRRWTMVVTQQGHTITSRSSNTATGETDPAAPMLLRQPDGGAPPPLVAIFTVEDSAGGSVVVSDTLPVMPPPPLPPDQQPEWWDVEVLDLWLETGNEATGAQGWKPLLQTYLPQMQEAEGITVSGKRGAGNRVAAALRALLKQSHQPEVIEFVEDEVASGSDGVRVLVRGAGSQKGH